MNWSKLSPAEKSALVATEVMGWKRSPNGLNWMRGEEGICGVSGFNPSTSIADAMLVLKAAAPNTGDMKELVEMVGDGWRVDIINGRGNWRAIGQALEDTISLCALRAHKIQIEE